MVTTAPTPAPANPGRSFETLLSKAARRRQHVRSTRSYALDHGFDEQALVRYASGACGMYERSEIEALIGRCEWARQFVVKWIKQQRRRKQRSAA